MLHAEMNPMCYSPAFVFQNYRVLPVDRMRGCGVLLDWAGTGESRGVDWGTPTLGCVSERRCELSAASDQLGVGYHARHSSAKVEGQGPTGRIMYAVIFGSDVSPKALVDS